MSLLDQCPSWLRRALRRQAMQSTSISILGEGDRRWVRWLYAGWSGIYDKTIDWDPAYRRNLTKLAALVDSTSQVLDVGIGTGIVAEIVAPRAATYVGLDYSGAMLARAARKIAAQQLDNVVLQWGDAKHLPFADERFDVVLSSFVLPHFARAERGAVILELTRVLRPGGALGLFLAQGERAPVFPTRPELESYLAPARLTEITIDDCDDVYRVVLARRSPE